MTGAAGWLAAAAFGEDKASDDPSVLKFCAVCPEHLVDDLLAVVLYISRFRYEEEGGVVLGVAVVLCGVICLSVCV